MDPLLITGSEQLDYGGTASGSSAGTLGGDPNAVTGSSHGDPGQILPMFHYIMITDFSGERPDTFTPHHELYGANQLRRDSRRNWNTSVPL